MLLGKRGIDEDGNEIRMREMKIDQILSIYIQILSGPRGLWGSTTTLPIPECDQDIIS